MFSNENEQIRYFCNNKNDTNNDSTNNNSNTDDYVDDGNDDKVHDDNNNDDKIITKIITLLTKNSKTSKDQFEWRKSSISITILIGYEFTLYVDNFGLSMIRIDGKFIFFLLPWWDSLINVPGSMLLCSEQSRVSAWILFPSVLR